MVTDVQTALGIIQTRLVQQFQPLKIILFGSQATGRSTPESDIDMLVVLPQVASKHRAAVAMRRSLADLPMGKDIIVATPEDISHRGYIVGTVLHQAITEGKVLYEQESSYFGRDDWGKLALSAASFVKAGEVSSGLGGASWSW